MATVGGLSSGTSNGVSMYGASMRGFGGLASGLDTDSLIEGMTLGTRTKIQQALKKKTTYQWQMDAYRSITDKLIGFSQKYLDVGNANSPFRASFFDKTLATPSGANSKFLTVGGTSTALDKMSVTGIKQLAKDSSLTTSYNSSNQALTTGDIKFGESIISNKLEGGKMTVNYDGVAYDVKLEDSIVIEKGPGSFEKVDLNYDTPQDAVKSINQLMGQIKIKDADGKDTSATLAEKVKISTTTVEVTKDDGTKVNENRFALDLIDPDDKKVYIGGGTEGTLKGLGFMNSKGELVNKGVVEKGTALVGEAKAEDIVTKRNFGDFMAGKQITFSYNGVTKSIKFPENKDPNDATKPNDIFSDADKFAQYLNKELSTAFGSGRIEVTANGDALSFETKDKSSVFKITDADKDIMGENGVLGIGYATTNRLNRETSLAKSGLSGIPEGFGLQEFDPTTGKMKYAATGPDGKPTGLGTLYDADGKLLIEINGKKVEGLTVDSTLLQVTSAINASDAGVKISYLETADRFSIAATDPGAAGKVEFGSAGNTGGPTDFLSSLFGMKDDPASTNPDDVISAAGDFKRTEGQDAIMTVKYEGNVEMDITRNSNSFNLDGATFNLTGTFGYTKNTTGGYDKIADTEEVSFSTAVDTDKVTKVIKEMIDDYNKVLAETFGQVSTKPNRDYGPLTDDEKGQLNTDEIKKLEDKAKEGILFNDPLLRSLSDQLRSVFSGVTDTGTLEKMGISLSSDYSANGKISFNEEKFKNALTEDPDKIKELFTKPAVKDANGDVTIQGGFSVRLKSITDSFAKKDGIPKGSLVEKAGTTLSSTAINQNSLKTLMDEIDKQVDRLKDTLQVEIDRYTKQFSTLEQLVSQMNAQSSWLSSALGG